MKRMIQAELLKMRHSTMGKMTWLVPVAAVVLGYLISQVIFPIVECSIFSNSA